MSDPASNATREYNHETSPGRNWNDARRLRKETGANASAPASSAVNGSTAQVGGPKATFLPNQLTDPAMSILANLHGRRDFPGIIQLVRLNFLVTLLAGLGIAAPLVLAANRLMRVYDIAGDGNVPRVIRMAFNPDRLFRLLASEY